jgi:hypothetical protein
MLVLALAGMWPLLRQLGLRSWVETGLVSPTAQGRRLGVGFALGFGSLACVAALAVGVGARAWNESLTAGQLTTAILKFGATAAVVAVLEELLFRGALFGSLRRAMRWELALGISSLIYALVHFFQKPPPPPTVEWYSGLVALGQMLGGFIEPRLLIPAFFTLTLAGAILALAYHRSGNLWFSIGLHAGWIFWLKAYKKLTRAMPDTALRWWGTDNLIDGWFAAMMLAAVLVVLWLVLRPGAERTDES